MLVLRLRLWKISSHSAERQSESTELAESELLAERERERERLLEDEREREEDERASTDDSDVDHSVVCFLC